MYSASLGIAAFGSEEIESCLLINPLSNRFSNHPLDQSAHAD